MPPKARELFILVVILAGVVRRLPHKYYLPRFLAIEQGASPAVRREHILVTSRKLRLAVH